MLSRQPIITAVLAAILSCACGGQPSIIPNLDPDYRGIPLDMLAADIESESSAPDSLDVEEVEDIDPGTPGLCTPGKVKCDGYKVTLCNDKGTGFDVVEKCNDDIECTSDSCENGVCVYHWDVPNCCHPPCGLGSLCIAGECSCTSMCGNKQCGDDGCGGTCGECPEGNHCNTLGQCVCTPDCDDKQCGDDGCSGSCGNCLPPAVCTAGQCICTPQCEGKVCGDDGCGGKCGQCPLLHVCTANSCTFSCPTCPIMNNCSPHPFGPHVYFICTSERSWHDSRDRCKDGGTTLVTISSAEENAFCASILPDKSAWLGYYEEWFDWHWITGEGKSFEAWGPDQPDDGDFWTSEDCAEMWPGGAWNDNQCGKDRPFICEFVP